MTEILLRYIRTAQPITTSELVTAARLKLIVGYNFTETMIRQAVNSMSSRGTIVYTDEGWTLPRVEKPKQKALF